MEMFSMFPDEFEIRIVAEFSPDVPSSGGPRTAVDDQISEQDDYDIVLVPGGRGTRRDVDNQPLLEWIARAAPKRAVLTNMHIDLDYETLEAETPDHITPAFDGMKIELDD